jgi:hypothetical protein
MSIHDLSDIRALGNTLTIWGRQIDIAIHVEPSLTLNRIATADLRMSSPPNKSMKKKPKK